MAEKETVKSLKKFTERIEKGFKGEADFDRVLYTFVRDYSINYFNKDKNNILAEQFAEYKISNAYKGKLREQKKQENIDVEMNMGNIMQKVNSEGVETHTVITLLNEDNPFVYEIDNDLKYKLFANYSDKIKKDALFEVVRDLAFTAEKWKIAEEVKNGKLKYNALTLKERMEYSKASVREKMYEIMGNDQNLKNKIIRDAGVNAIPEAVTHTLRVNELRTNKMIKGKKEDVVSQIMARNKKERNDYLVEGIEELQSRRDEEIGERTSILVNGIEYEISQEEEMISNNPEVLNIYPALKYKFNSDGTRKTITQEVQYGLNKINDISSDNEINKDIAQNKKNQVYDLINEDFIFLLFKSQDKEKTMKLFINSIGKQKSLEFLNQLQNWQNNKEKMEQKENEQLEEKIETNYRKVVNVNTDLEKADDFIDETARKLAQKDKSMITVTYYNKGIPKTQVEEEEQYNVYVDVDDYIDNIDDYEIDNDELVMLQAEEEQVQKQINDNAKQIYEDKIKKAIEKDPKVEQRERQFEDEVNKKSKKAKEAEEVEKTRKEVDEKSNEKRDNDIKKQDKEIEEKINEEDELVVEDTDIVIDDEDKRVINGYTTGNYTNEKEKEIAQESKAVDDTKVGENYKLFDDDETVDAPKNSLNKHKRSRTKRELVGGEQIEINEDIVKDVDVGENYVLKEYEDVEKVENSDTLMNSNSKTSKKSNYENQINIDDIENEKIEEKINSIVEKKENLINNNKGYVDYSFKQAESIKDFLRRIKNLEEFEDNSKLKDKSNKIPEQKKEYKEKPFEHRVAYLEKHDELRNYKIQKRTREELNKTAEENRDLSNELKITKNELELKKVEVIELYRSVEAQIRKLRCVGGKNIGS